MDKNTLASPTLARRLGQSIKEAKGTPVYSPKKNLRFTLVATAELLVLGDCHCQMTALRYLHIKIELVSHASRPMGCACRYSS